MAREVCEVCTGSYTGEFSPKWKGPWAYLFGADGKFLELDMGGEKYDAQRKARLARLLDLRAKNRVSLSQVYSG